MLRLFAVGVGAGGTSHLPLRIIIAITAFKYSMGRGQNASTKQAVSFRQHSLSHSNNYDDALPCLSNDFLLAINSV